MSTTAEAPAIAPAPADVRAPNRVRHWKQKFDANADFIFTRRMNVGLDPEHPWVMPGDPVPRGTLTHNRLKTWWRVGLIAIKDWVPGMPPAPARAEPDPERPPAPAAPDLAGQQQPSEDTGETAVRIGDSTGGKWPPTHSEKLALVESMGGGWFAVLVLGDDGEPVRLRGRQAVDEHLARLGAREATGAPTGAQDARAQDAASDADVGPRERQEPPPAEPVGEDEDEDDEEGFEPLANADEDDDE